MSAGNFAHGTDEGVGDKQTSGSWTCKIRHIKNVVYISHSFVPIRNGQLMVVQVKCSIIGPSAKGC